MTEFGPTGEIVYSRTYARTKPDGTKEVWPETVQRVVNGNLALVDERYQLDGEREALVQLMLDFKVLPAGRHLWASGVKNAQHLFNCWVAGHTDRPSEHFEFAFLRLMEGGGVGASYSNSNFADYPPVQQDLFVEIVCDPEHPDYTQLLDSGVLSTEYDPDWMGAFVIEDSREGWAAALVDLIDTYYRDDVSHFRRVYDVSRVRPAGAKLKTFGGRASGPLPLAKMLLDVCDIFSDLGYTGQRLDGISAMEVDHAIAQCVVAGGVRRSARMAMMHWQDPQIHEFINIKQDSGSHWTTNISVEVDDQFWELNKHGYGSFAVDRADMPKHKHTLRVLEAISEGMVNNGEPGFWDSTLSNVGEPNTVQSTNPCGEICLEPWEPCNLGHVNLAGFVTEAGKTDYLGLIEAHRLMTRFLIRATFSDVGDPKSREVLDRNRRIGVGHFGVASYLALIGKRYSEAPADKHFTGFLRELAGVVDVAAEEFSHDLRIPVPVKKRTVAPTGTIAKMPGVSEGIHPIFSKHFIRRIRLSDLSPEERQVRHDLGTQGYEVELDQYDRSGNTYVVAIPTKDILVQAVEDLHGVAVARDVVESADDLTLNQMLAFQALYQSCWADNAVSFTANVDPDRYTASDVAQQLTKFGGFLKGATIFPEMSMPQAPYTRISKEEYDAALAKDVADGVDEDCGTSCPIR